MPHDVWAHPTLEKQTMHSSVIARGGITPRFVLRIRNCLQKVGFVSALQTLVSAILYFCDY